MNTVFNKHDRLMIYQDPITEQKEEGKAELISFDSSYYELAIHRRTSICPEKHFNQREKRSTGEEIDMKIIQLKEKLRKELQAIRPGIFYYEAKSTEQGGKIIMGRHVCVAVPADKPVSHQMKNNIRALFNKYFAATTSCKMPVGNHTYGSGGIDEIKYREIVMEY